LCCSRGPWTVAPFQDLVGLQSLQYWKRSYSLAHWAIQGQAVQGLPHWCSGSTSGTACSGRGHQIASHPDCSVCIQIAVNATPPQYLVTAVGDDVRARHLGDADRLRSVSPAAPLTLPEARSWGCVWPHALTRHPPFLDVWPGGCDACRSGTERCRCHTLQAELAQLQHRCSGAISAKRGAPLRAQQVGDAAARKLPAATPCTRSALLSCHVS
jgi:hypothetical protein